MKNEIAELLRYKILKNKGKDITVLQDKDITQTFFTFCRKNNMFELYDEIVSEALCQMLDRECGEDWDKC